MSNATGPTPLRGLTAEDRKYWDEVFKNKFLQQGLSEEEIDRKYRNFHFKRAFKDSPDYNQLRKLTPDERDKYFNENAYTNFARVNTQLTSDPTLPRVTGPYQIEQGPDTTSDLLENIGIKSVDFVNTLINTRRRDLQENWNKSLPLNLPDEIRNEKEYLQMLRDREAGLNNTADNEEKQMPWNQKEPITVVHDDLVRQAKLEELSSKVNDDNFIAKMENRKKLSEEKAERRKQYIDNFYKNTSNSVNGISVKERGFGTDKLANEYADKMEEIYQLENSIVDESNNPYLGIKTPSEFKEVLSDFSATYSNFEGHPWLPLTEANYTEIYNIAYPLIQDGKLAKASTIIDDYFEKIVGKNQPILWSDENGESKNRVFLRHTAAGILEGTEQVVFFVPSWGAAMISAAINPEPYQLDAEMNYWARFQDKAIHSTDAFGIIGNVPAHKQAQAIMGDSQVYGTSILDYGFKGGYTAGAMIGDCIAIALDIYLTRGLATASRIAAREAVRAAVKKAGREISEDVVERVCQMAERKAALRMNKAISGGMQLQVAYGEAVEAGLGEEDKIIRDANNNKQAIKNRLYNEVIAHPDNYTYNDEDYNNAYNELYKDYNNIVKKFYDEYAKQNTDGIYSSKQLVEMAENSALKYIPEEALIRAKVNHKFDLLEPAYDEKTLIEARRASRRITREQTIFLATSEKLLGGVVTKMLPFRKYKELIKPSDLTSKITGTFGKTKAVKRTAKDYWNIAKEATETQITEMFQETVQGINSSINSQIAENSAEEFVNNHFFGDGQALISDYTTKGLSLDEAIQDTDIEETLKATFVSTTLFGGWSGIGRIGGNKTRPGKKREDENILRYAAKWAHFLNPVNSATSNVIATAMEERDIVNDYVNQINRFYSKPENLARTRGNVAVANYALAMMDNVANNDKVGFENNAFALYLAEAIMLERAKGSEMTKTKLQQLKNMAEIRSATDEQKKQAIIDWKAEATSSVHSKMSDAAILATLETNGKRLLELYNEVERINTDIDNAYGTTISSEGRSKIIFGQLAAKNLEDRIKSKVDLINNIKAEIADVDLGTTDETTVNKGDKEIQLSGQDILNRSITDIAYFINPNNRDKFSKAQQKIIDNLVSVASSLDMNFVQSIADAARETRNLINIKKEYEATLKNPNKVSKKTKEKKEKVQHNLSQNKKAKAFQKKVLNTKNPAELRRVVREEVNRQSTQPEPDHDITNSLKELTGEDVKKRISTFEDIDRHQTAIQKEIRSLAIPTKFKEILAEVIDRVADAANTVNELYDISNYALEGLSPEQQAQLSKNVQKALQKAKDKVENSINNIGDTPKSVKPTTEVPEATDLGDRDIDTAPPVNNGPVKPTDEGTPVSEVIDDASLDEDPIDAQPVGEVIEDEDLDDETIDTKATVPEAQKGFNAKVREILTNNTKRFLKANGEVNRGPGWYQDENGYRYLRFHSLLGDAFSKLSSTLQPLVANNAIKRGNAFDSFCRVYFETHDFELAKQASMTEFDISKSYDNIKAFCDNLISQGYKTVTHNLIVSGEFGGMRIAGDMDILLEKDGKFYVADFKASMHNPHNSFDYRAQLAFYKECLKQMGIDNVETLGFIWLHSNDTVTLETVNNLTLSKQYLAPFGLWKNIADNSMNYLQYLWEDRLNAKKAIETTSGVLTTDGPQEIPSEPASVTEPQPQLASEKVTRDDNSTEPIQSSTEPEKFEDSDPRSITKVVRVQPHEDGPVYAYPVRDEDVQVGDMVEMTYNGKTHTQTIGKIQTIEEYEAEVKATNSPYTLEALAKYPRPKFYDRHSVVYANNNTSVNTSVPTQSNTPTPNNRSDKQQEIIDNNITPAVREIRRGNIEEHTYDRLGMPGHTNIETILEQEKAFQAVNQGFVREGDEVFLVCSEEVLDDGKTELIIWIATNVKSPQLGGRTGKFKGIQLLNVLDTTNIDGPRKALVEEVKKAWAKGGNKEVFIYNSKTFKVEQLAGGVIPIRETNPVEANSEETINSTNLSTNLSTDANGKHGFVFRTPKGTNFVRPILRQTRTNANGSQVTKTTNAAVANKVEVTKKNTVTQSETNDVMLCTPTPSGWKAAHSVYILRRNASNAVAKYTEAIKNGKIGDILKKRIADRITNQNSRSSFSDLLLMPNGVNEYIKYDSAHSRLDLGTRNALQSDIILTAIKTESGKYNIVNPIDARILIDDNQGQGFTLEEISTKYLISLIEDPNLNISLRINMDAIEKNPDILEALISDGMLWCPNAIPGRMLSENTRFRAPINPEEATKTTPVETTPSPVNTLLPPNNVLSETSASSVQKENNNDSKAAKEVANLIPTPETKSSERKAAPRVRKRAGTSTEINTAAPTTPSTNNTQVQQSTTSENVQKMAQMRFEELPSSMIKSLEAKGITKDIWESSPTKECENYLNCIGVV